jgi:hypothetical protein
MTASDFSVGDLVISVKERDGMPIGTTGVIESVNQSEVRVKTDPNTKYSYNKHWYYYKSQLNHYVVEILGDDDEDCI